MNKVMLFISSVLMFLVIINCEKESESVTGQFPKILEKKITKIISSEYLLFLPKDYLKSKEEWPLLLYLHGIGSGGEDLDLVKKYGPPKMAEESEDFPFILVSPQNPRNIPWESVFLNALLDEIIRKYRVDKNRIYVTGIDWGGYATWILAINNPVRFAAIAPGGSPGVIAKACEIKHIPVWVFHGAKDSLVSMNRAKRMVDALEKCGGNVKFTVYPEVGREIWDEMYHKKALYDWFLEHRRK